MRRLWITWNGSPLSTLALELQAEAVRISCWRWCVDQLAKEKTPGTLQSIGSWCCSIIGILFVFTFILENFLIPSSSMASTLLTGDHLVADRSSIAPPTKWAGILPYRDVRRGEPIVFYKPVQEPDGSEAVLVKRVIGIPGDHLRLRNGIVYLNGVAQNEPHAAKPTGSNYDPYRDDFPAIAGDRVPGVTAVWALDLPSHMAGDDLVVPPQSYFVMGDNRTNSLDSRYWGFVPRANIIGRPLILLWSFPSPDNLDQASAAEQAKFALHEATHFFTEMRWRRSFQTVN